MDSSMKVRDGDMPVINGFQQDQQVNSDGRSGSTRDSKGRDASISAYKTGRTSGIKLSSKVRLTMSRGRKRKQSEMHGTQQENRGLTSHIVKNVKDAAGIY
jgi:hypothetical protein